MKSKSHTLNTTELQRALNLAIRGTTAPWQAAASKLDSRWAAQVYKPEIKLLNRFRIKKGLFTAGITAAALVTVALDRRSMEVWAKFSRTETAHDPEGFDAAGYLVHLIQRVTEIDTLGRNPAYQHYLFQNALAVVLQWLKDRDRGVESRFSDMPVVPPLDALLEKVRTLKGEPITPTGFRPGAELRDRVPALGPLLISHTIDEGLILAMAFQAAGAEKFSIPLPQLAQTVREILKMSIPPELAHPAAMAAAVVDITLHPETRAQWEALWTGDWHEDSRGVDLAGRFFKGIRDINRRQIKQRRAKTPKTTTSLQMSIDLYCSCRDAARIARQERCVNMRWSTRPQVSGTRVGRLAAELNKRWAGLGIPECPDVAFLTYAPAGAPAASPAQVAASKRAMGNRQETGRLAEQYFIAHHASIDPRFAGTCIDKTTSGQGHDFQTLSLTGNLTWVEVKGTAGPTGGIEMTLPEWEMARKKGDDYFVVIIRDLAGTPYGEVIQNPFQNLRIKGRRYLRKEIRIQANDKQIKEALQRMKPPQKGSNGGTNTTRRSTAIKRRNTPGTRSRPKPLRLGAPGLP